MQELSPQAFVTLMSFRQASETVAKVAAVICVCAMLMAVWPGEDD